MPNKSNNADNMPENKNKWSTHTQKSLKIIQNMSVKEQKMIEICTESPTIRKIPPKTAQMSKVCLKKKSKQMLKKTQKKHRNAKIMPKKCKLFKIHLKSVKKNIEIQ